MKRTTLCYIENNGEWLMLYRNRKPDDPNEGKWLGIGGKIEPGETPDECNMREVCEETGLRLRSAVYCGLIEFRSDMYEDEDMYLYYSDDFEVPETATPPAQSASPAQDTRESATGNSAAATTGKSACSCTGKTPFVSPEPDTLRQSGGYVLPECDEGELRWIPAGRLMELPMWEGDKVFLRKLLDGERVIALRLSYEGESCTVTEMLVPCPPDTAH